MQAKHSLEIVHTGNFLQAQCNKHDWSRRIEHMGKTEPLRLTSYYHWMHQLEELEKEKNVS